ncbi:MAG: M14 family metallopeptidase [Micropepsaceae bacterium]
MTASELFSADYFEAREKFLFAAQAQDATLATYRHPHAKGPKGEDLFIDVAILGPQDASSALLVISGTHGVEGYAGSAIQNGWLRERGTQGRNMRLIFIHALNPHGFAWNRRVTEDNVDLNRNFIDHSAPPPNPDYEMLSSAIAPASLDDEALDAASRALRNYAKEHGAFAMQETISKGQYTQPDGMYYGGNREQWSAGMLRRIVAEHVGGCRRAAVIDIHTGLGSYGEAELISEDFTDAPAYRRARDWWGETVCSTRSGDSVSAQVYGSLDQAIPQLFIPAETTMICLEFGTYSTLEVFQALRADNWLHTTGGTGHPDGPSIKAHVRRAFYPDLDDWKDRVWSRGKSVIVQAIQGLEAE